MKKLLFIISLAVSITSCKKDTDTGCKDYQIEVSNGQNNTGCENAASIYAGSYYDSYPDWTSRFRIEVASQIERISFNGIFYGILNINDLNSFTLPEQYYSVVTGAPQQHLVSGNGTCNGTTLTLNYTVLTSDGQTLVTSLIYTRH